MSKTLTHADVRGFLKNCGAAIELDQRRVDSMPAANFHPQYDREMWRIWRAGHVSYINDLLCSVDVIPSGILTELTKVATTYDPKVVGHVVLDNFADAVSGSCPEELATAEGFFGWVVKGVRQRASGRARSASAKEAMTKWLAANDPLRIAEDPECQYDLRVAL